MEKNHVYISFLFVWAFLSAIANLSIAAEPDIASNIIFHKSEETLNRIMEIISSEQTGAYLRYGDGEINAATSGSLILQTVTPELRCEMQETFRLNGPTILKGLPLHCKEFGGFEPGMFEGNHEWSYGQCLDFLNRVSPLWGAPIRDVYSQVALHYLATYNQNVCINFLKFLRSKCCLFVGNENVPQSIRELLFGPQSYFVKAPSCESYSQIDRIEKECLEVLNGIDQYKVVVVAMGCPGCALQKRLLGKVDNIFLFNFGSLLDALCGWDTRMWISLSKFNAPQFLSFLSQKVRVLYTAALLEKDYEKRKIEYIKSFNILAGMGYQPYVVEAITQNGPTFFDDLADNVFYSKVNDSSVRNKGVNEARSMLAACKHFNFEENDIILKMTGRYRFNSDNFIKLIEANCDVDAFILEKSPLDVFTGCFAMRYKYFKDMLEKFDFDYMEREQSAIEWEVPKYLEKNRHIKVMKVQKVDVTACVNGGDAKIY